MALAQYSYSDPQTLTTASAIAALSFNRSDLVNTVTIIQTSANLLTLSATLNATGFNGIVGATTPAAGTFTILTGTSSANQQGAFYGYSVIASAASANNGSITIGGNGSFQGIIDYSSVSNTVLTIKNTYANASAAMNFVLNGATALAMTATTATFAGSVSTTSGNITTTSGHFAVGGNANPYILFNDNTNVWYLEATANRLGLSAPGHTQAIYIDTSGNTTVTGTLASSTGGWNVTAGGTAAFAGAVTASSVNGITALASSTSPAWLQTGLASVGTSTTVARQDHTHIPQVKAWVCFDAGSSTVYTGAFNVSSVTYTNNYTRVINFTNSMTDAYYASTIGNPNCSDVYNRPFNVSSQTVSACNLLGPGGGPFSGVMGYAAFR